MGTVLTLRDYLIALRKGWLLVVAFAIVGAGVAYAYAQAQPEIYRSQSSVIVIPAQADNTSELVQGSNYVQNLVATYTVVATSPKVLGPVIDSLDLEVSPQGLAQTVTVENPLNTTVLTIAVVSRDPAMAQKIADAVADELATAVRELSPQNTDEQPAVRIDMITPAQQAAFPISPNTRNLVLFGGVLGLLLGVAVAVLRSLLATRLTSQKDLSGVTDVDVIGEVPSSSTGKPLPLAIRTEPTGSIAEAVRGVAANLRFANVDGNVRVIMLTSTMPGEGKTSLSVSLAQILAEQGSRVLLIDADLRRASIAEYTQLEESVGLTTVLLGDVVLDDAMQSWGPDGLKVLTSGVLPPNPGQLLNSEHLKDLFQNARDSYDYVIVDTPPVLTVSDALWLAPVVDGILIVTRERVTKRDLVRRTVEALEPTRVPIMGIIFNGVHPSRSSDAYYRHESPSHTSADR